MSAYKDIIDAGYLDAEYSAEVEHPVRLSLLDPMLSRYQRLFDESVLAFENGQDYSILIPDYDGVVVSISLSAFLLIYGRLIAYERQAYEASLT